MALPKTTLQFVFNRGVNTGVDPKVLTADLLELENGLLDRVGAIVKRFGTSVITNPLYTQPFLARHRDKPMLLGNGSARVFDGALGGTTGNFDLAGTPFFADIEPQVLYSKKRALYFYPDIALLGSVLIIAYSEYTGSGYDQYAVTYDTSSGLKIEERFLATSATARFPRISTATLGYVWYVNAANKLAYRLVTASGTIDAAETWTSAGASAHATQTSLDVADLGDAGHTVLVAYVDVSNFVQLLTFDGATFTTGVANTHNYTRVGCFSMGTNNAMVLMHDDSVPRRVYALGLDKTLSTTCALVAVADCTTNMIATTMTGVCTAAGRAVLWWTEEHWNGASGVPPCVMTALLAVAGGVGTVSGLALFANRARVMSKGFNAADPHVLLHHRPEAATGGTEPAAKPAQSAYFLCRPSAAGSAPPMAVGKALVGRGGPGSPVTESLLGGCSGVVASGGGFLIGALAFTGVDDQLWRDAGMRSERFDDVGYARLAVTLGAPSQLKTEEVNGLLLVPNSNPLQWDGQAFVEQGFLQYPEGLILTHAAGGGSLGTGQYGWVAVYEWTDAQGQTHRSSPSKMITYTPAAGETVTIKVPSLTFTDKTHVRIVLYRTVSLGSVLYRLTDAVNDPTSGYRTFTDTYADSTLTGRQQLYTTGNVLETIQPQPHRVQCLHQGRHFYVDRERETTTVWYSRWIVDGDGVGWNDTMQVLVPEEGGRITALASFQDRLLIFKEAHVWCCYGNGLDDNGTGQDYSTPVLICSGYGCVNQKSLVALPVGLAFLTEGGLALMRPDFTVDATWGQQVKYFTDTLTIAAGVLLPVDELAIWITTAGDALVHGYHLGQWSTFTAHAGVDAVECGGVLYFKTGNSVVVEDRSTHLDNGGSLRMKLTTGWIMLDGGKEARLKRIHLVGQNITPHTLACWPRFDGDPVWSSADKVTFNANTFGSAFDYTSYYGAGLSASYLNKAYELVAGTRRQKMRAVQIQIFDEPHDGVTPMGEGYSISRMALVIAQRPPRIRRESAREMG